MYAGSLHFELRQALGLAKMYDIERGFIFLFYHVQDKVSFPSFTNGSSVTIRQNQFERLQNWFELRSQFESGLLFFFLSISFFLHASIIPHFLYWLLAFFFMPLEEHLGFELSFAIGAR